MEIEGLLKYIYTFTHTPDISFEQMKGLGVFSGIALKMLFLDAHMKAADKEELFGECLQRRFNYLKSALAVIDPALSKAAGMKIKPKFKYFLPENVTEELDNILKASKGGILSNETAITLNPLVGDKEAEMAIITDEKAKADENTVNQAAKMASVTGPPTFVK
jgi:SPP1 family phage portal protein